MADHWTDIYHRKEIPAQEEEKYNVELTKSNSLLFRLDKIFAVKAQNEEVWLSKDAFPYTDLRVHEDVIDAFHRDIVKEEREEAMAFLIDAVYEAMGYDEDYVRKQYLKINFINNNNSFLVRYGQLYPLVVAERVPENRLLKGK